ncbi:MAG: hypothetical protein ACK59Y_04020 [Betaproteobacteria bacterium]|jgi:hypothetical protein|nr:hypothetical protein [Betaproteobacteria bacterium]
MAKTRHFRKSVLLLCMLPLGGCVSAGSESTRSPLVADKVLRLSPSLSVPLEAIVAGAVLFAVIDPLAPNWEVEARPLGEGRYLLALTMKRFVSGGDGEAYQVMQRAAERLQREAGAVAYSVAAYSEGIDSGLPAARRVARALIELR